MKKFMLTGASGFVGKNLVEDFDQMRSAEVLTLNLREKLPSCLPQSDAIIHLAGKAHDLKNVSDSQAYFDINYGLTKELFDLFLQSDIKDFIYFSSVKAVADTVEGVLTETDRPNPITAYGQSKLKAESYLLSKVLPEDKRLFIFRPCMIHGPGNKGNLNLLYRVVKTGIPYPLGSFDNNRSFLSIDNLLFIIENILNRPEIPGGIYHLADDKPLATTEVIEIIGEASGAKSRIWNLSPKLINLLAKMGDRLHLPFNSARLQKLTENYIVSNAKIKQVLKIQQLPYSAREGLFKTIKSFG